MKRRMALIFGAGLVTLVSCPQPSPPSSGSDFTSISGQVMDASLDESLKLTTGAWTGGAGSVYGTDDAGQKTKLGDLNANGSFTASLPVPSAAALKKVTVPETSSGCTGKITVSNPNAQISGLDVSVDANQDGTIAPITLTTDDQVNKTTGTGTATITWATGALVYADQAVNTSGNLACTADKTFTVSLNTNINYVKGWNKATLIMKSTVEYDSFEMVAQSTAVTMTSGTLPTNNWVLTSAVGIDLAGGMSQQSFSGKTLKNFAESFLHSNRN
ncbi:hypothetical protein [Deinococcus cavernae]|nr:hypothetical protein [Deinococcus cavernae]